MHALIIDDSKSIRRAIGMIVQSVGFEVIEAEDGLQGLSQLERHVHSISVVLVDWRMPVMDGIEFVRKVRSNESYNRIKVIMVSTEADPDSVIEVLDAGADDYVIKPFSVETLVEKIQNLEIQSAN